MLGLLKEAPRPFIPLVLRLWQLRQDMAFIKPNRAVTAWGCSTQILTQGPMTSLLCPVQQAGLGNQNQLEAALLPHPLLVRLSSYHSDTLPVWAVPVAAAEAMACLAAVRGYPGSATAPGVALADALVVFLLNKPSSGAHSYRVGKEVGTRCAQL